MKDGDRMAYLHYYRYHKGEKQIPYRELAFLQGWELLNSHSLLRNLEGEIYPGQKYIYDGDSAASVDFKGNVYVNLYCRLTAVQWFYTLAHCLLHLAFGHFDKENIPEEIYTGMDTDRKLALWNKACDIYITRFLMDIRTGMPTCDDPAEEYSIKLNSEEKIYEHLCYLEENGERQDYGTTSRLHMDMVGLEHPVTYRGTEQNRFAARFYYAISHLTSETVSDAGGHIYDESRNTPARKAARWFIGHYPLLGSMAASYKLMEDADFCIRNEIEIAAVDAVRGEIYVNPACGFSEEEWKFVLAHELLHAGLMHHRRCQGRNPYLWNIACDYVVNGWLHEMQIGRMPLKGLLYDEDLKGLSAESIYDLIVKDLRRFSKLDTFRGYKKGDILSGGLPAFGKLQEGVCLDEFYRNTLREGLDFHLGRGRGLIPRGLAEEIYALSMPAIPWDVELARWFDSYFPPLEKHRTYARPSRRQSATPDIPRPRSVLQETDEQSRTFGVVLDTSGSVSTRGLGMALGSIASYAAAKEVPFVRVVFCDSCAYDAGYLPPEDIAGCVEVKGRGGTVLQQAVTLLERAEDFPKDGPILIITDGYIEDELRVRHEHAYLLPKGNKLPFQPKGKVFYFQ